MKFALVLFTVCILGCGGSGGSVEAPAAAPMAVIDNHSSAGHPAAPVVNNVNSGNTTINNDSGNTTTTDNSINNSHNTPTGGQ